MKAAWLIEAEKHVGLAEIPGKEHNPTVLAWLKTLGAWWSEDETPWCGTFVAHAMRTAGIQLPKAWYRAKAWADWGRPVEPCLGCVVVFERQGGGHVGFLVGRDSAGRLMVLGGNQRNGVNVAPFLPDRAIAYRWPLFVPSPASLLPVYTETGPASTNEA